jgi:tetratricopeptide (TPR) repeat protein
MGDAINVAARLQAAARPMAVLIADDTYRRVVGSFDCADRGSLRVKGKAEPLHVYEVRASVRRPGRAAGRAPARRAERPIELPLIGRQVEIAALCARVNDLMTGAGGLVTVVGEAGVGKTRLVTEVRRQVAQGPALWLGGQALPFGKTISYRPFQEMLGAALGGAEEATTSWHHVEGRVALLFGDERDDVLPYLATLLGLEVPGNLAERVRYLDGEGMRRQILRSVRRLFEQVSRRQPLVLMFEDVHWIDHSSAELLEHLLPLTHSVPLLICCISRDDAEPESALARLREIGARQYAERYTEIALSPLTAEESGLLLGGLLADDNRSARLPDRIRRKAEGNPFFVEEVIRSLAEARAIAWDDGQGRWRAMAELDEVAIPNTIQGVIGARLDRLSDDAKAVLKMAAVIGRSFTARVLRAVAAPGTGLDAQLAELQRLDLIREDRRAADIEYIFKHALTQQTAYEGILLRQRRELHRRVGAAMEDLFADRLEEYYPLLAYHFAHAEAWMKAQDYLLKAGDSADQLAADAETLAHYSQALVTYESALAGIPDRVQWAAVRRRIGEALSRQGDYAQARTYLERSLRELGRPLPTSHWRIRAIIGRELLRQIWRSYLPRLPEIATTQTSDPAIEESVQTYRAVAWIYIWSAPEVFLLSMLLALRMCERGVHPPGEVQALAGLGLALDHIGRYRLAGRVNRRAVALADRLNHPLTIATAYGTLGHHCDLTGELQAAVEYYTRSERAYRSIGEVRGWGSVGWGHCFVLCQRGEYTRAVELSGEMVRLGEQAGDRQVHAWGMLCLGQALLYVGELDQADRFLTQARDMLAAIPDRLGLAYNLGNLGLCRLRRGDLDMALAIFEEGARHVATYRVTGNNTSAIRLGLAEACLIHAEQCHGADRTRALARARAALQAALALAHTNRLASPAAYRLRATHAWLSDRPATARRWWENSLAAAQRLGMPYEQARTHLEAGRRLGDDARIERAAAIFADLGARADLTACGLPTGWVSRPRDRGK